MDNLLFALYSLSASAETADVAAQLEQLQTNLNYVWVIVCAALVFLMQAGFMCLESGWSRAKNSINVAVKNMADFTIAVGAFWLIGYPLMFGDSVGGLFGWGDFFLDVDNPDMVLFFCFQVVFAGTAATIDSGAIAERTKFMTYLWVSLITSALIYPVFGHWAWGSLFHNDQAGWLEALGFTDFAGSTVVHSVGGWMALTVAYVVGPRIGKYDENGNPQKIRPHNLTIVYLGGFILMFGWFGFNCGSTVVGDASIAGIAFNTIMAASFGVLSASGLSWYFSPTKHPEPEAIVSGLLAGLVGITAGCASVGVLGAIAIGLSSGVVYFWAADFVERVLKIDDVVGAAAVHGFCGAWGTICVGIFMLDTGEHSRLYMIGIQTLGVVVCAVWTIGVGGALALTLNALFGLRSSREDELAGLNVAEHGATSTLIDIATSMHKATTMGRYDKEFEVEVEHGTEIGEIAASFNTMLAAVRNSLSDSEKSKLDAIRSLNDAESLRKVVEDEKTKNTALVNNTAAELSTILRQVEDNFNSIQTATHQVQNQMDSVMMDSKKVDTVLELIDELSRVSNFLALNAMIEATRAGESGKSFGVVAGEMQQMSLKTQDASQEIQTILTGIKKSLEGLLGDIGQQGEKLSTNKDLVNDLSGLLVKLSQVNSDMTEASQKVA